MFEGFSPETVDFLWGIRMNNNREWFLAHKSDYTRYLYEPMKALGQYLFEPYADHPGVLLKVSRIYRDARRLHGRGPYKDQYFEITPEGISYGMVFWKPRAASMEAFRRQIAQDPQPFLSLVERTEDVTGIPVTADLYKRSKPCPSEELERFFRWKGNISCIWQEPFGEDVFRPELAQRVRERITMLDPLTEYLSRFGA